MPHRLSDDSIREFQRLWKQETGQDISLETAREYAKEILGLVELVYCPSKPDQA